MNKTETSQEDIMKETERKSLKKGCCGIYGLRNKSNGKWYIGQSKDIRERLYKYEKLICKQQPKLHASLCKYGYDMFEVHIIELCSKENLNIREPYWIIHYDSINNGYNIAPGGNVSSPSEETRIKLSKSHMGQCRPHSEETKKLMSKLMTGREILPEWREKLRQINTGKKLSDETKRKMSLSSKGNKASLGKCWITNGFESKSINKTDDLPIGWRKGRLINKISVGGLIQT